MAAAQKPLQDKIALITGGGTGIGASIARAFAGAGARVIIAGRNAARLATVAKELGVEAIAADVSDEASVTALFAALDAGAGGPDVLVNNAGVTGPVTRAVDMDLAAWDETMAINVRGTLLCIKQAVPRMKTRGGGSIINMSSLMGLRGQPMRSAYTASKYAVLGITDAVSQEVGVDGIRVNALCPGAVNGALMQRVIAARAKAEAKSADQIIRTYTDKASLRRWVEPEEVAAAALFLASPASASITGERLRVDAGRN